ncbi:MAG: sugar phosphate isomerase/epimerase family protein [Thermomicrobiales bacterium]
MENLILGSTIVFAPHPIDVALEGLAEVGYRNVEIGAVKGWFEHIDPDTVSDAEIDRIGRKLGDLGLNPVSLSGHTQLQTHEGKDRFIRAMDIAKGLGMPIVNTFTGDAKTDEEREAYFANVQELCDYAEKLGLTIGMETDSNMLPTAKIGVEILAKINRPGILGFNYDPGNVIYYTGADPYEDIMYALPQLVHFHLKDKKGGQGVFDFPPTGEGDIDLARLLKILEDAGYTGPISAEVEFDENGWPDAAGCLEGARRSVAGLHALGLTL